MRIIDIDTYYPAENEDYRNVPLIEFLEPVYEPQVLKAMTSFRICTEEERTASPELRLQYVQRLFDLFVPSPEQLQVGVHVWNTICQTYARTYRRKTVHKTTATFRAMFEAFAAGEPPPRDGTELTDLPSCIAVIGTPGCGKTQLVKRLLRRLSQDSILRHPQHAFIHQRLFVWAEAGTTKTDRALAEVIYEDLYGTLIAVGAKRARVRGSARRLGIECAIIAKMMNLGALVIDEIQHWLKKGSVVDKDAVEFLTTLVNEIGCVVVIIGTWEALPILRSTARSSRRVTSLGTCYMRKTPPGEVWDAFIQMLFMVQYTTNPVECTPELVSEFWQQTLGIPDLAVRLMAFVQATAIANESERITVDLVRECAKAHMDFIQPALRQMRNGASESDTFIYDAEPTDVEDYIRQFIAEKAMNVSARRGRSRTNDAAAAKAAAAVATGVMQSMGIANAETAQSFANSEAAKDPSVRAMDIVDKAIRAAKRRPSMRSKAPTKQAEIDQAHAALPPLDIRRIVHQCKRTKSDPEVALDGVGHLFHIDAWVGA